MSKKIKVFINKLSYKNFDLYNYFPYKVFFDNFDAEKVDNPKDADILFEKVRDVPHSLIDEKNKPIIIVSGENIKMRRNLFIWIERIIGKIFGPKKKYSITDVLDNMVPYFVQKIPISYYFPKYLRYLRDIKSNPNHYAILVDDSEENSQIYKYPVFYADYHHRLHELTKKNEVPDPSKKKFCAFAVSSNSDRDRVRFFKKLSRYKKVDSYGKVKNNTKGTGLGHWRNNSDLFSNYKFVICFENSYTNYFVSEKITNAMMSGAIPVYRGPVDTKRYFNTKSFINYDDYGSYEKMIEKIIELDQDDEKYKEYAKRPWLNNEGYEKLLEEKKDELVKFYEKILGIKRKKR